MIDATFTAVTGVPDENGTLLERVGFLYCTHMPTLNDKDASMADILGAIFALLTTNPVLAAEAASVGDRHLEEFLASSTEQMKGLLTELIQGLVDGLAIRAGRIAALEAECEKLSEAAGMADFYRDELGVAQDKLSVATEPDW